MAAPNSFRDPYWADLAGKAAAKVGVPADLLVSVLTNGERSNANQVSEVGAKSPFQVTPTTRDLVLKRDGIDAFLSPENAAEVGAIVLKDGMKWAKGRTDDPAALPRLAAGYYHAGGDLKGWGPKTLAYMDRVTGAAAAPAAAAAKSGTLESGFAAFLKANPAVPAAAAAPAPAAPAADPLAEGFGAYLQAAAAPKVDAASLIPGQAPGVVAPPATNPIAAGSDPTLGQQVVGAGEAGLALATGATGGMLGMAGGALGATGGALLSGQFGTPQAAAAVEQAAAAGAQALTYQPRTPAGQQAAAVVGQVLQQALPAMPLTAELGALGRGAAPVGRALADTARAAPAAIRSAATQAKPAIVGRWQALQDKIAATRGAGPAAEDAATPGTRASGGAAGTDMATQRQALATDLPVPIALTKGQATRSFEQLRFEQETAKDPNVGTPLRERYAEQNQRILSNFDAWADQTGAEAPSLRATGAAVDAALVKQAAADKLRIRAAYKAAEKSGEMADPVPTDGIAKLLDESSSAESVAPVLTAARRELVRLGGAVDDGGALVPRELALGDMELLRRFVNRTAGTDATNIKYAADLKRAIDASTEGLGGAAYKEARALRQRFAQNYEDHAVLAKLLNMRRGTTDRQVVFEDVFDHSILRGGLDDVRQVRRVLQRGGNDGMQAWRELQGATARWIKDEATKNVATDQRGNQIVSAAGLNKAIRTLDHDGKLDFVFGKKGAQQMRDINELTKVVYTSPPGAVNTSNTASVLLAALGEAGAWGSATGLPVPVLTGLRQLAIAVKNRRIQQRVQEALTAATRKQAPMPPAAPTVH